MLPGSLQSWAKRKGDEPVREPQRLPRVAHLAEGLAGVVRGRPSKSKQAAVQSARTRSSPRGYINK